MYTTFYSHSVAYVSRSGGMSNELNNIIIRNTNGVYEGVAIGGDRYKYIIHSTVNIVNYRYPGTSFSDHIFRYHDNPDVKMIVLLGEVSITQVIYIVSHFMYLIMIPSIYYHISNSWVSSFYSCRDKNVTVLLRI